MKDPGTIRDELASRFAAASSLAGNGDMAGAQRAFAQITRDFPECHEAHYMLGRTALASGDTTLATSSFEKAEALDPGNPEYLMRLGQSALQQGDSERAVHELTRAMDEAGDVSAELIASLGQAYRAARRFDDSRRAFEQACELDPAKPEHWSELASAQQHDLDIDAAEESLNRAIALAPRDAALHAQLALMCERANRLDGARHAAEAALAIEAAQPMALLTRARLAKRTGDLTNAQRDLERAIRTAPSPEHRRAAQITMSQVLDQSGDYDGAYRCMRESKTPLDAVHAPLQTQGEGFLTYIAACREKITRELVASWPSPPADDRQPPVFFVGFPRSGTTLLEQMLAAHPGFVTTDERQSLPKVRAYMRTATGSDASVPGALGQLSDDQIIQLRGVYWHDIDELFGSLDASVRVVDKHPLNTTNLAIVRRLFPEAPVIMSLRDPRDVCVSCMMNLTRTSMAVTLFHSFETTANFYAAVMDMWLHYRDVLGLRFIETRYENVISDAEAEVRRVITFLGADWNPEVLRFREHAAKRAIRSPSYEQVTRKLHRGSIGRWRNYEKHMREALDTLAPFVTALCYDNHAS